MTMSQYVLYVWKTRDMVVSETFVFFFFFFPWVGGGSLTGAIVHNEVTQ
jgi:hypothetical protein